VIWTFIAVLTMAALLVSNAVWWWRFRRLRRSANRRSAEIRVLEQRLRLQADRDRAGRAAVFNCMREGLIIIDANDRIRLVNQALQQLFTSIPGDDLRGRTLLEALQRHELSELAERARAEGQALGLELESGDRPVRWLQVNATTFQEGAANERGVILVFHDVTRLKELESTRREFVANVSHELRTPLALIKGYVETLIDGARNDPEVCLRFLQTMDKHTIRLTFLIEDLLTISQLESGQIMMNQEWGALRPLVTRVMEDYTSRAAERSAQLVNEVPPHLELRADFDRLQQVFSNLLDNAIKYGRPGGRVVIGAHADPDHAEMWVCDDGPGIPPEALDRVFERFYRVDTARSREQGGTGLGLSIVKHIVQAHGGEVRAESDPGKGATFRLKLPLPTRSPSGMG
jgi:two-component system phosphate regulon sensor histidine kinase PhoR